MPISGYAHFAQQSYAGTTTKDQVPDVIRPQVD